MKLQIGYLPQGSVGPTEDVRDLDMINGHAYITTTVSDKQDDVFRNHVKTYDVKDIQAVIVTGDILTIYVHAKE